MRALVLFPSPVVGDSAKLTQAGTEKTPRLHRTQTWGTQKKTAVAVSCRAFFVSCQAFFKDRLQMRTFASLDESQKRHG